MSGDIYYDNVSLLLHCDGTDGSTTFTDSSPSPQTVTSYGDAHVETDQSKFGGASASFDGSGDYLTVSRDAFTFSGDFTIECWVYLNSTSAYVPILDGRTSASYSDFVFGLYPTSVDFVTVAGRLTATDTISLSAWHHIAVTRSSGVIRLFTDGVVNASTWSYAGAITPVSANVLIGTNVDGNFLNGYIDELRATNGVARYTSNFTPPTEAFPNETGFIPVSSLALSAFAPSSPGQIETVSFSLQTFSVGLSAVYPPKSDLALSSYPVSLDGVLLPSAIEFRHAPLAPWVMPMTSPVYPPLTTLTLDSSIPGVSIHGLWSPSAMLFGWEYDDGDDTISIPLSTLFELTSAQANATTGDWRAVVLALVNSMWDAYVELDDPPKAVVLEYNPGYMMANGPFEGSVKSEYSATTYLTFPEKYIAGEP